jgi:hypothetical protein
MLGHLVDWGLILPQVMLRQLMCLYKHFSNKNGGLTFNKHTLAQNLVNDKLGKWRASHAYIRFGQVMNLQQSGN